MESQKSCEAQADAYSGVALRRFTSAISSAVSHSNQAMLDALDVLGVEFNDDSHELINRAWDIARTRGFATL